MARNSFYRKSWFVKVVFAFCLLIIFFVGWVSINHANELKQSTKMVVHTYKVNVELEQILSYLKDAETGQRGFLITKDSAYLEPYLNSRERINNTFAQLKILTKDNDSQQKNLRALQPLIDQRINNFYKNVDFYYSDKYNTQQFNDKFLKGKQSMDAIRDKIAEMIRLENDLLNKRRANYNEDLNLTPVFLFLLLLVTLLLIVFSYYKINKDFSKLKVNNENLEIFKESANQSEIVSKHGSWSWNIAENTFEFSDNLYRILGEEPQSFPSNLKNFMDFVHPDDLDKLTKEVNKMLKEHELNYIYYRIIQKGGEVRHLKAYGKILYSNEGTKRLLGTTADITDEVDNLKEIEERNLELEQNNKELSAFNYVASHDLQEPLRKIQTFISRIEDREAENFSDSGKTYLERIKNASSRMRSLIDDLLQFSRTNRLDKVAERTNINQLLEQAKQNVAEMITEKKATIKSDPLPDMEVIPFQIQQLFSNLINNSIKYSKDNVPPEITITYSKVEASESLALVNAKSDFYHFINFKDNGIGFEQQYAEKIFTLFNRLHSKSDYSGTGIGLSICKKIIENHNGFIFAKGYPEVGASFSIYLPIN